MQAEQDRVTIFETDPVTKAQTQQWVRESITPRLVAANADTERALRVLHYASTWNLNSSGTTEAEKMDELAQKLGVQSSETVQITPSPRSERGRYRLIGSVRFKDGASERTQSASRFRAVQIFTRMGEMGYVTPNRDIDILMDQLCRNYSALEVTGNHPVKLAMRLAYFYTIGTLFIHPFADGNHRAFDRFLEYAFSKAGRKIKLPQDETGNIPYADRFRILTTNTLTNFLSRKDLSLFNVQPPDDFLTSYDVRLNQSLRELISSRLNDPFYRFFYAATAREILKWTGNDHAGEINDIQAKAQKEGNFQVIHRRA